MSAAGDKIQQIFDRLTTVVSGLTSPVFPETPFVYWQKIVKAPKASEGPKGRFRAFIWKQVRRRKGKTKADSSGAWYEGDLLLFVGYPEEPKIKNAGGADLDIEEVKARDGALIDRVLSFGQPFTDIAYGAPVLNVHPLLFDVDEDVALGRAFLYRCEYKETFA